MTPEDIMNERKNKFLKIGRNEGFMSNAEDLSNLTIKKNNFDNIFKSKKLLFGIGTGLLFIASLIFSYLKIKKLHAAIFKFFSSRFTSLIP